MAEGIEVRIAKDGTKSYRASVWSAREGRRVRQTFPTLAAARAWRQDAAQAVRSGRLRASRDNGAKTVLTVRDAVAEWIDAAQRGSARTRGRKPFAASTIRSVEQNYRLRVQEHFGDRQLDRVTLLDLQEWVDELDGDGLHPSTIETSVLPLRLAYRRAKARGKSRLIPRTD